METEINELQSSTCCFTGHRNLPEDKLEYIKAELQKEIAAAVADGYTCFISGFADGADLLFAKAVLNAKAEHPDIRLEAAIPYRNRIPRLMKSAYSKELLLQSDIFVLNENYNPNCFLYRNRYMVRKSSRCIAVYDGREKGGTSFTIRYAHTFGCEVRMISV